MRARASLVGLVVLVVTVAAGWSAARADDAQKARELFQQGTTLYDLGQFDRAIEAWQNGYKEKADPGFLYNIAQAYRQLGDATKAIFFYRGYLRNSPKAHNRAEVEQKIAALQKLLTDQDHSKQMPPPGVLQPSSQPPLPSGLSGGTASPPPADSAVTGAPPEPPLPPNTAGEPRPPAVQEGGTMAGGPPTAVVAAPVVATSRRFDVLAALGTDTWTSGVQGSARPSFAFTLGVGYTFGAPDARVRFRLGALFGYTFLNEQSHRESFTSVLIDPTVEVRLGSAARWYLVGDLGFGVLSISGIDSSSALLDHSGPPLMVNGTQSLAVTRLGIGLQYRLAPDLSLFAWPALATSKKKDHFYSDITREELLVGVAYRMF